MHRGESHSCCLKRSQHGRSAQLMRLAHSALKGSEHHVRRIEAVNKVGRKCCRLLGGIDYGLGQPSVLPMFGGSHTFRGRIRVRDENGLDFCHDLHTMSALQQTRYDDIFWPTCRRLIFRYGCTIGRPSAVVQITLVICSFPIRSGKMFLGSLPGGLGDVLKAIAACRRS